MISSQKQTFIIAEAGVNHNGSIEKAKALIQEAAASGADAVKFQTFRPSALVSRHAPKASYQKEKTGENESQLEMIEKLKLSDEDHFTLEKFAKENGILFLSTPFDHESAEFLIHQMNLPLIKIGSGDLTNAPLLLQVAQSQKPIILSTGMGTLAEVKNAIGVITFGYLFPDATKPSLSEFQKCLDDPSGKKIAQERLTLLHCTTQYPAPLKDVHLRAMQLLESEFSLTTGYSDHTQGIEVPIYAVAAGAKVIEKHFTLDRNLPGPDHASSLEPSELREMVRKIREVEQVLGTRKKEVAGSEQENLTIVRRSLVAARPIQKGEKFSSENLTTKRPGTGRSPYEYWEFLGQEATQDYQKDEVIQK